jgi:hypothetical protein
VIVLSAYKNRANDGTDVDQDGFLSREDAGQSRKAGIHEDMADLKTQIGCLASRTDVNQEKMDTWIEGTKALEKRDDGLSRSDGGLSRKGEGQSKEDESQPGRNGDSGGRLRR